MLPDAAYKAADERMDRRKEPWGRRIPKLIVAAIVTLSLLFVMAQTLKGQYGKQVLDPAGRNFLKQIASESPQSAYQLTDDRYREQVGGDDFTKKAIELAAFWGNGGKWEFTDWYVVPEPAGSRELTRLCYRQTDTPEQSLELDLSDCPGKGWLVMGWQMRPATTSSPQ